MMMVQSKAVEGRHSGAGPSSRGCGLGVPREGVPAGRGFHQAGCRTRCHPGSSPHSGVLLCCALLCRAVPSRAGLCRAVLCRLMLCRAVLCCHSRLRVLFTLVCGGCYSRHVCERLFMRHEGLSEAKCKGCSLVTLKPDLFTVHLQTLFSC